MTDTTANKRHVKLQKIALQPLRSFENQQKDNFMSSSTTFQEPAILQHWKAIHQHAVILAVLDSIHDLIHYFVPGFL